jgi:transposase
MDKKLYHTGFRGKISRSTLADANETRDWRIYRDFAQLLILVAKDLYAGEDFGVQLDETVYALDASTIDLCLSVFPWARFRKTKSAVKLHTLLDLRGNIPSFIDITEGKVHDVNVLDILIPEAGAIYVMDRGYLDFGRLFSLNQTPAFFIIRSKTNTKLRRLYSHPVDISCGLRCDQTVVLTGYNSRKDYPQKLRRIRYHDELQALQLIFLTNHFTLPALTIADLYRCRWQVELFFKWIKQHLRIKSFFGTSENAVKTQIWIAISVYVLVAILKKRLRIEHSLYTILQLLSLTLFEKVPLQQLLTMTSCKIENDYQHIQLNLFET